MQLSHSSKNITGSTVANIPTYKMRSRCELSVAFEAVIKVMDRGRWLDTLMGLIILTGNLHEEPEELIFILSIWAIKNCLWFVLMKTEIVCAEPWWLKQAKWISLKRPCFRKYSYDINEKWLIVGGGVKQRRDVRELTTELYVYGVVWCFIVNIHWKATAKRDFKDIWSGNKMYWTEIADNVWSVTTINHHFERDERILIV